MRHSARTRLVVSIALIVFGVAVTIAAADSLINTSEREESQPNALSHIDGAAGAPVVPESDTLGAQADSAPRRGPDPTRKCGVDRKCEGDWGSAERGYGVPRDAEWVLVDSAGGGGSDPAPRCGDTCANRLEQLFRRGDEQLPDIPTIRECTSSIGGEAICFDFGNGHYFVGDAPQDGEGELGFCTSDGYYYISAPSLTGGTGAACPGDRAGDEDARGGRPAKARECTSSIGGEATCFGFGGGNYLVSDPAHDGAAELGFCTSDGYYYVSGPSGDGGVRTECPDAAAG